MIDYIPVGDSAYDRDWEIVQSFVRFQQNHNKEDGERLIDWFNSKIPIYLDVAKERLYNPNLEYLETNQIKEEEIESNRNNFNSLQNKIFSDWEQIKERFTSTFEFNTLDVCNLFYKIYQIFCFQDRTFSLENCRGVDVVFPLTNQTGFYSYNVYLYCYFNRICLLGFPADICSIRKNNVHPDEFIRDEILVYGIYGYMIDYHYNKIKNYYELVLNKGRDQREKKICIFAIFLSVSTNYGKEFIRKFDLKEDNSYETITEKEYKKFLRVLYSQCNHLNEIEYEMIREFGIDIRKGYRKTLIKFYMYVRRTILELLEEKPLERSSSYKTQEVPLITESEKKPWDYEGIAPEAKCASEAHSAKIWRNCDKSRDPQELEKVKKYYVEFIVRDGVTYWCEHISIEVGRCRKHYKGIDIIFERYVHYGYGTINIQRATCECSPVERQRKDQSKGAICENSFYQ